MKSGSDNTIIEPWRFELNRLIHEGTDRYQKGDYKTSEKKLRAALEISLRQDLGGATAETIRMLGDIAAAKGELQVARSRYFDALEIRRKGLKMNSGEIRVKIENSIPPLLEALGVIETRLHLWKEAKNHLLEAKQKYLEQQVNSGVAMAYRGLGTIAYETGDHNDALLCFTKALGSLEEKDRFSDLAWDIRARRAVLLGEVVDAAAAYQVLKECLSHWQARRHVRWQAETEMQLGKVALLRSCRRDAQRHFERALKQFTEVGDAENARIAKVAIAKVAETARS